MSEKISKLMVNLRGWYVKGKGYGALNRGFVFNLNDPNLPEVIKNRVLTAYNEGEEGYCKDQKMIVPVVVKKVSEEDIIEDLTEKFTDLVGDKISTEDLEDFKKELEGKAPVKKKKVKTSSEEEKGTKKKIKKKKKKKVE